LFCNKDDIVAYCEGLRPQNGHVNVDRTLTISGQQFLFGLYNTFIQCFMVQPVLKRKTILLLRCECRSGLQRAVRTCTWRKALKIEATCSSEDKDSLTLEQREMLFSLWCQVLPTFYFSPNLKTKIC